MINNITEDHVLTGQQPPTVKIPVNSLNHIFNFANIAMNSEKHMNIRKSKKLAKCTDDKY